MHCAGAAFVTPSGPGGALWPARACVEGGCRTLRQHAWGSRSTRSATTSMTARGEEAVEREPRARPAITRRAVLSALMAGAALSVAGGGSGAVNAAEDGRVWGAAELDFRMYVCGATGKFCPAMTKVKVTPARQIDATLAQGIAAIPKRVLETSFSKRGTLLASSSQAARRRAALIVVLWCSCCTDQRD